jgi:L-seryl-tRNA(Ser) seleniumtransferase
MDLAPYGIHEPQVQDSIRAGVDIVTFSGDKLLGGPQAGYISGRQELITKVRRNPMFRALRLDKLQLQAMEQTLRAILFEEHDAIPALAMIRMTPDVLKARAEGFAARVAGATVVALPTWLVALSGAAHKLERKLRAAGIIARVENDRLVMDLRTVLVSQEAAILEALRG